MAAEGYMHVIRDTRLQGLETFGKRIKDANRTVLVGVPKGKVEQDGTSIAMIAAVHEFGSGNIPERSFLRAGIIGSLDAIKNVNRANMQKILRGGNTIRWGLGVLGAYAVGVVQKYMVDHDFAPNAPSTIARKKSSKPLIDSGALRQAITWIIEASGNPAAPTGTEGKAT